MNKLVQSIVYVLSVSPLALAASPTTAPVLPKGHPDISQLQAQQQQDAPALPSGHPDLKDLMQKAKDGKLPAGHPQIPGMGKNANAVPTTQPQLPTLFIEAQQGTAGAPAIGADPVTVEAYHNGEVVFKTASRLQADGKITVENIPVLVEFQPLVKVTHNGVDFITQGEVMDMQRTGQRIGVTVYETTDVAPEWRVKVRHVMVSPAGDGAVVMEMMNTENPSDRAYLGPSGADGKRAALSWPLPKGATDVQLMAGLRAGGATIVNDCIVSSDPMLPGATAIQFRYRVPAVDGKINLLIDPPAGIEKMMLFVPEDGSTLEAKGLESLGSKPNDRGGVTRYFKGQDIKAGVAAGVVLGNLPSVPKAKATGEPPALAAAPSANIPGANKTPQIVGGLGAVIILFVGAAILLKPKKA